MALHNLTTPVMAVVAVAAVAVVAGLGGLFPTAQNTQCVWQKQLCKINFPSFFHTPPFLPRASPP